MWIGRSSTAQGWTVNEIPSTPMSSCPVTKPPAGERGARSRGHEGHCSGVNAKRAGVGPAVACISSKQGSLSLSRCARTTEPGCSAVRHGVLSHGLCAPSIAPQAGTRQRPRQTWRGSRGRNWRRGDVRLAPGGRRTMDGGRWLPASVRLVGRRGGSELGHCRPCP